MTGSEQLPDNGFGVEAAGSRVEAAEAGVRAEIEERLEGRKPDEHVTALDAATEPAPVATVAHVHHHHPPDPNAGVVRGRLGRGALLAAAISAAVTVAAVVLLAIAIGNH